MQTKSLLAVILGYGLILSPIAYGAWTVFQTAAVAIQQAHAPALWQQ